jgi:hypothetical protein
MQLAWKVYGCASWHMRLANVYWAGMHTGSGL